MSGLCGWAGYAASEGARQRLLDQMGQVLRRHDSSTLESATGVGCGLAAASLHGNASFHGDGEYTAAVVGRPVWRDDGLAETARDRGHACALAQGYRSRGPKVMDAVRGRFSLAVVHDHELDALLAVDRMGTLPLNYSFRDGCLVFGSAGATLQLHPASESDIDPQAIFNYFFFCQVPAPGTIRKEQGRLLPGHCLVLQRGRIDVRPYVAMTFSEEKRPLADLEKEFHELLRTSVGRDASGGEIGCFLSGGTDSSTVAGVLSELRDEPVRTYSMGFEADGYDEMEYARCAVERFGTDHHEYYVTPEDVAEAVPGIAEIHSDPFANESAVPTYLCARLAAGDGVERLLAGDGGDELFAGNERYAKQRVFDHWRSLPRRLRRMISSIIDHFPAGKRVWPVRKARSYIAQASTPLPERLYSYALLLQLGASNVFERDFLGTVDQDAPLELARQVFRAPDAERDLNRILALDYKFTLADNDLVKVTRSCELAGVDVAYPLMSDDLLDFANRLPIGLKLKGSKLRWFFKHALRDFLPRKILTKPKHGFGLPFGVWLKTHSRLQQLSGDSLTGLKTRGIIRPAFVDDILRKHRSEHASYYGVMVWMLIMLEQWFRVHEDSRAAVAGS